MQILIIFVRYILACLEGCYRTWRPVGASLKSSLGDLSSERQGANLMTNMPYWGIQEGRCVAVYVPVLVCVSTGTNRKLRICVSVNFPLLPNSLGPSVRPVASQSPVSCLLSPVARRQPRLGRVPGAYSFSIMMKCQSGTHSSCQCYQWQHRTRSSLLPSSSIPLDSISPPVTWQPVASSVHLVTSPGQVAENFVPRFACFRQFGIRNRAGYKSSIHLSFHGPLPAQVAFVPGCYLYFLYDFSNIK